MRISVVIPSYNREFCLSRTLQSIYNQKINAEIEIILVDDASTDNTSQLIKEHQNKGILPIKYIRNNKSVGGAVSRNLGAKYATGEYIAFLDSDDEWLPNHLESKISLIKNSGFKGCYGTFYVTYGNNKIEKINFLPKPKEINMANYILSGKGDARTSTFLFEKDAFEQVRFDENLKKHQDWDLAIRFDMKFGLILDENPTVIIHNDVYNRMSNSNNHEASQFFFEKHEKLLTEYSKLKFYTSLAKNTLRFEGKNERFYYYLKKAKMYCGDKKSDDYFELLLMSIPGVNIVKIYDYLRKNFYKIR